MNSFSNTGDYWRKCTTCKNPIGFGQKYWICSVSTCNRIRTDLVFCDLRCFDAHVPVLNHRDAGAFEKRAPAKGANPTVGTRSPAATSPGAKPGASLGVISAKPPNASLPQARPAAVAADRADDSEILVVVSKVKKYIRDRSEMNTSEGAMDVLSRMIRILADQGIASATKNGRKTVLDRDL